MNKFTPRVPRRKQKVREKVYRGKPRILSKKWSDWLKRVYYDRKHVASYGGVTPLMDAIGRTRKRNKPTRGMVQNWLESQTAYTLHRDVRNKFQRDSFNSSIVTSDQLWQMDLTVMASLASENDSYKYILCVIDVFSKMVWVEPLKLKNPLHVLEGFKRILKRAEPRTPESIQSDKGKEFDNKLFKSFVKNEMQSNYYTSQNPQTKCAVVERFQRTLKQRMWRYFTKTRSYKYIDILQDLVTAYNSSYHRNIGRKHREVRRDNPVVEIGVLDFIKSSRKKRLKKLALKVGTPVRLSKSKMAFEKGYTSNWTREVFYITRVVKGRLPLVYKVGDYSRNELVGTFYQEELQPVKEPDMYEIDNIISERINPETGLPEAFVSWKGYSKIFNQWLPKDSILQIV